MSTLEFVRMVARMQQGCMREGVLTADELILHHGRAWKVKPHPEDVRCGMMGECYLNASKLATDGGGFIYCEGYANGGGICAEHAWCLDRDGKVVDPTWAQREIGDDYYGIAIKTEFVLEATLQTGHYSGVLTLAALQPVTRWRHEINDLPEPI